MSRNTRKPGSATAFVRSVTSKWSSRSWTNTLIPEGRGRRQRVNPKTFIRVARRVLERVTDQDTVSTQDRTGRFSGGSQGQHDPSNPGSSEERSNNRRNNILGKPSW